MNVTRGCNPPLNDLFCVSETATRGQAVAMLVRAFDLPVPVGSDRFIDDDGSAFEADIEALAAEEITLGCNPPTNNRFCPDAFVTRGDLAAFLHRAAGEPCVLFGWCQPGP